MAQGVVYGPGSYLGKMLEHPQHGSGAHGGPATGGPQRIRTAGCPESISTDALEGGEDRGDQEDKSSTPREANQMVTNKAK